MKTILLYCFVLLTISGVAQTSDKGTIIRQQVFGTLTPVADLNAHVPDTNALVTFSNGYIITKEQFLHSFREADRSDTSLAAKKKFLNDYILNRQKAFEAMDQNLDTATAFQIAYLKYKQNYITPYLNEGYTRVDAEALPNVKYALQDYYCGMVLFELMNREVWSKSGNNDKLRAFYNEHPELYQGQSFEISRTKVVYDYQKQLTTEVETRAKTKFPCKINEKTLSSL